MFMCVCRLIDRYMHYKIKAWEFYPATYFDLRDDTTEKVRLQKKPLSSHISEIIFWFSDYQNRRKEVQSVASLKSLRRVSLLGKGRL